MIIPTAYTECLHILINFWISDLDPWYLQRESDTTILIWKKGLPNYFPVNYLISQQCCDSERELEYESKKHSRDSIYLLEDNL